MTLAGGRFKVYVAFGDDPFEASPTWTDVTDYALSVNTTRGRSSELDQFQAGTAQIQLDNTSRLFDPEYSSGTYFGDIKPGVPVKVEFDDAGLSLEDEPLFYGYATGWQQQSVPGDTFGVCVLQAVDGFGFLSRNQEIDVWSPFVTDLNIGPAFPLDERYGRILRGIDGSTEYLGVWSRDVAAGAESIALGDMTIPGVRSSVVAGSYTDINGTLASRAIVFDLTDAELVDGEYIPLVVSSTSSGPGADIYFMVEVTDASASEGRLVRGEADTTGACEIVYRSSLIDLGNPHHAAMAQDGIFSWVFGLDGHVLDTTSGTFGTVGDSVAPTGGLYFGWYKWPGFGKATIAQCTARATMTEGDALAFIEESYAASVAIRDGDYTGERIGAILDAMSWPAGLRDLDTGQSILGPQGFIDEPPINVLRRIETSEQGWLFMGKDGAVTFRDRSWTQVGSEGATSQETFSDDGSDVGYLATQFTAQWDWTQVRNQITVSSPTAGEYTHQDAASVDGYGPMSESVETVLRFRYELENLANYRATIYGEPSIRFEPFSVRPEKNPSALYAALIPLELADRVTVERTPTGTGSAIELECLLQSISWSITPGDTVVTFQTSPAGISDFATWGSGEWTNDMWGY